ncbi:MAG TPA: hypothetical protein VN376_03330, partial [Longilinea sp.]|nr:hypothetical protein [Longilinea sp.]
LISLCILALLASGCSLGTQIVPTATTTPELLPPTITVQPTATLTPTATPTLTPEPMTVQTGFVAIPHPLGDDMPYTFIFDNQIWQYSMHIPTDSFTAIFVIDKWDANGCTISTVSETGIPVPLRYFFYDAGRWTWAVYEYADDVSLYNHGDLFLSLTGRLDEDCRMAQDTVLSSIVMTGEYLSNATATPIASPEALATLEGYSCSSMEPLLRIGDSAYIVASSIWLRSEPTLDNAIKLENYLQFAPVILTVLEGPECVDTYTFWRVQVTEMGEGGTSREGWMAEADDTEYFLSPFEDIE